MLHVGVVSKPVLNDDGPEEAALEKEEEDLEARKEAEGLAFPEKDEDR